MYAHARIVDPRDSQVYERGAEVPDDLPGIEELQEYGSVSDEEFTDPDPYGIQSAGVSGPDADAQRLVEARNAYERGDIDAEEFARRATEPIEQVSSHEDVGTQEAQS